VTRSQFRNTTESSSLRLDGVNLKAEDPGSDKLQHKAMSVFHLCLVLPNELSVLVQRFYDAYGTSSTSVEAVFAGQNVDDVVF